VFISTLTGSLNRRDVSWNTVMKQKICCNFLLLFILDTASENNRFFNQAFPIALEAGRLWVRSDREYEELLVEYLQSTSEVQIIPQFLNHLSLQINEQRLNGHTLF